MPSPHHRQKTPDVSAPWLAAMRRGDFEAAWQQTDRLEFGRRAGEASGKFTWEPTCLLWDGADFSGRRVLVRCDHGLGDTLQFARLLPRLAAVSRSLDVLVQPAVVPLLQGMPGFGVVHAGGTDQVPKTDVAIEIMELAYAFRLTAADLPGPVPYLAPDLIRSRARSLPPFFDRHFRVGLLWAAGDSDPTRSIPLPDLEPLNVVPAVSFYSLQQGPARADEGRAPFRLRGLSRFTGGIVEAAAALLHLDLLITVDSMLAHLAGALGRPVWLLLQEEADWRWMEHRTDSPWYPTMRIFRRAPGTSCRDLAGEVAAALMLAEERKRPRLR